MQDQPHPVFPCHALPSEPAAARLLGLYPQRQEGLWMQRVRVPAGRLEPAQWTELAAIVRRLTPGEPLHLTTRQDVEIHGLSAEAVPTAQSLLRQAGLTGLGSCGDTTRNVTVCPCSGLAAGAPELLGLAGQLTEMLQSQAGAFALPRKLKVSLSACPEGCGQPWLNDLGLLAVREAGHWQFRVILAGSLGPRPATGIAYGSPIDPDEVLPFALAVYRVFAANGDRAHRGTARLRHVRQRLGDGAFLELVEREFRAARDERAWPHVALAEPESPYEHRRLLRLADGNLPAEVAVALGDLAGREEFRVRIANYHTVVVFARDERRLNDALTQAGLAHLATGGPRVVACPGTRWCSHGLADTHRLAAAVRQRLAGSAAGEVLIAISGCPNGCAHSGVADVGAVGLAAGAGAERREVWNLLAGGQGGVGPGLAQPVAHRLATDDAADRIAALVAQAAAAAPPARKEGQ